MSEMTIDGRVTFPVLPEIIDGQLQNSIEILKGWRQRLATLQPAGFHFSDPDQYEEFVARINAELTIVSSMLDTLSAVLLEV